MSLEALFRKAEAAFRGGKYRDALKHLKKVERDVPDHPEVRHLKGLCLFSLKRYPEAERALSAAHRAKPNDAGLINALAAVAKNMGDFARAEEMYRRALAMSPDWQTFYNLGTLLKADGRAADAIDAFQCALENNPHGVDVHINLSGALRLAGRRDEAMAVLRKAADLAPGDADVWALLGHEALMARNPALAARALQRALDIDPKNASALLALGLLEVYLCAVESGVEKVRRAAQGTLSPTELSSAVFALNYDERSTSVEIRGLAESWRRRFGSVNALSKSAALPGPARPLRVGLVAAYFGQHPVAFFLRSWLPWAAAANMEVVIFHAVPVADDVRAAWHGVAEWVDLTMSDDLVAARRIAAADIDVLFNTAGQADNSRLEVFAHRPAPLQGLGFAYFCTTGLEAMDFVLADPWQCPDDAAAGFTETIVRLPHDYVAYAPPEDLPAIAAPDEADGLLVGSFNNPSKYGPATARLWSRVLEAVPDARLLLKAAPFEDPGARDNARRLFADAGIAPERLLLEGPVPHGDLLAAYNRIHLALDPLAYSGGLTTLESLWMGVPVVTLPGRKFCQRHSLTHLTNAGLGRFVAADEDAFVAIAKDWLMSADDPLARRRAVREAIRTSPISDGERYAHDLADALRGLMAEKR